MKKLFAEILIAVPCVAMAELAPSLTKHKQLLMLAQD